MVVFHGPEGNSSENESTVAHEGSQREKGLKAALEVTEGLSEAVSQPRREAKEEAVGWYGGEWAASRDERSPRAVVQRGILKE